MKMLARHSIHRRDIFATIAILHFAIFSGIAGCGASGSTPASTPALTPTASSPLTLAVVLDADREGILRGQSAVLQWNAQNVTAVTDSNFGAGAGYGIGTVN